ncbi:MAG: cytochrome P450 [Planctomycetota bacterium]
MTEPKTNKTAWAKIPGLRQLKRFAKQLCGVSPFDGDCQPGRIPLLFSRTKRRTLPFPHRWNYHDPIAILATYFVGSEKDDGSARHNRYLDFPGFPPVLVTRDPGIIRAILTATGDREGQFDRDTLPSSGIARATGSDTLLFSNGPFWRKQRKAAAPPFGKTALFQAEVFQGFAETLRKTVRARLSALRLHLQENSQTRIDVEIEPEIKALMLEMLVVCYFGAQVDYADIRNKYVPALERLIDHIVRDTVTNRIGLPLSWRARLNGHFAQVEADFAAFDELTETVLAGRESGRGMWKMFKSDVPDDALKSNLKVFLAGALEATTSFATWAIAHLARNPAAQSRVHQEVDPIDEFTPESLRKAPYLAQVLDETLRLTPSLYFLPRRATADTWVETADGRRMHLPSGTHILLDVWHANRNEDLWGVEASGFPATEFVPERWENLARQKTKSKDMLHFGFGHGARVCPGKHLAQLEVFLAVGVFVKLFQFEAVEENNPVKAGVSTKPADGTRIMLELRDSPR